MSTERKIELIENDDGWWTAVDTETGVASEGPTRPDALDALGEALEGYNGAGETPTEAERRGFGIDPAENESGELPEILN